MKRAFVILLLFLFGQDSSSAQEENITDHLQYEKLADSLLQQGDHQGAISYYKKALSIFPNSWKSYSSLRRLGSEISADTIALWLKKLIPTGIDYTPNIVFGKGGMRSLKLSIVKPEGAGNSRLPVIVYIHGGGWQENIKELGIVPLTQFARRGYIGVAIEYRLSKEAKFPAQIEDVKCAIRFLRAHAKQYNIDPGRIGVFGESAGGHLASLAGTSGGIAALEGTGGWKGYSSRVQAVCNWSGPVYFAPDTATNNAIYNLLGGTSSNKQSLAKMASPLTYITDDDPPFLIFHGTADEVVKPEQSDSLYKSLIKAKRVATLKLFEGGGHFAVYGAQPGAISGGMPRFRTEMLELMNAFFDRHLKK